MTKEELREHCEKQVKMCEEWAKGNDREPSGKIYEEHKLILDLIKALEQDGTDMNVGAIDSDCVSRKELLKLYGNRAFELQKTHQTDKQLGINWCINTLIELPPVTPTRKVGKLIAIDDTHSQCEECGATFCITSSGEWEVSHCPNCGISFKADKRGNENV